MSFLRFGKGTLGYDSVDDLPKEAPHGTTANIVSPTTSASSIYTYNGYLKLWVLSSSGSGGDTILSTSLAGTTLNIVTDATTWATDLSSLVSAGGVGGAGVANQIAFWASTVVLDGDNDLTWDNATKILNVTASGDPTLQIDPVSGVYAIGDINFLTATPQALYMSTTDNYTSIGGTANIFLDSGFGAVSIATDFVNRVVVQSTSTSLEPYGTSMGETLELRFKELNAVSGRYIGFKAPDSRTSSTSVILKLPPDDPTAGQCMAFGVPSSGVSTGFWFSPGSGLTGSGTANYITYWTGTTALGGEAGFEYNATTNEFKVTGSTNDSSSIAFSAFSASTSNSFQFRNDSALLRNGAVYSQPIYAGQNIVTWGYSAGAACTTGTSSTYIGNNAGSANNGRENVCIGAGSASSVSNTMIQSTVIGYTAGINITSGQKNTVLGWYSTRNAFGGNGLTTGSENTVLGGNCAGSFIDDGSFNTFVGSASGFYIHGTGNTFLGYATADISGAIATRNYAIALGYAALVNADHQWVVGSTAGYIDDAYFGNGVLNASPQNFKLNATGGSGTDIAGASFTLASGKGTGSGTPGNLIFQTPTVGSTGTTLQSLATRATVSQTAISFSPHGTSAGNTYELRFLELAANGTNYTAFKAADSLAQTTTYVWPSTDPTVGQVLSSTAPTAGVATLSWTTASGGGSGNIDGGSALTVYGGTSPVDGGGA